jgi:hypothetical protein
MPTRGLAGEYKLAVFASMKEGGRSPGFDASAIRVERFGPTG